jgi:basic membrane lipoprotein Med (substrate-binding protein (PBP1-ABC) superfamily)
VVAIGAVGACHNFAPSDLGAGLGASCSGDDECQGAKCTNGVCAIACGDGSSCPKGTICAAALCQLPVVAGFIYPGEVQQEPFTQSLELGRSTLAQALPYFSSTYVEDRFLDSDLPVAAASFYSKGARVVFSTVPGSGPALATFASQHADAQVFALGARGARENVALFDVRTYEGYYLAGIAAAQKSNTHRLGIIGSVSSPSVVASINAFALGAKSIHSDVVVEIKWMGDFHDRAPPQGGKTRERVFTEALLAAGADVIAHTLDNNISVAAVAQVGAAGTFAIGADVRSACAATPGRCIGAVYYNWAPIFSKLVDDYHKQRTDQRLLVGIELSSIDSPIDFAVSEDVVGSQVLEQQLDQIRGQLASDGGVTRIFDGPIQSTGQCEAASGAAVCVPMGQRLDDAGLAKMCWLVQGIVEKDTNGVDQPAMVPQEGDCAPTKN